MSDNTQVKKGESPEKIIERQKKIKKNKTQQQEQQKINQDSQQNKHLISHIENDLICPICLKYIVKSATTSCGHCFCQICIEEFMLFCSVQLHYKKCIKCEANIRKKSLFYCRLFDNIIQNFIRKHHSDQQQDFQNRKQQNFQWNNSRSSLEVGKYIDIRDKNYVWCSGFISRVVNRGDGKNKLLCVHYEGFPNKYDEQVMQNSDRISEHRFFSSRKDIPHYNHNEKGLLSKRLIYIMDEKDKKQKIYMNFQQQE